MGKFRLLHQYLIDSNVAVPRQFRTPSPLPETILTGVHCPEYVSAFNRGTLDEKAIRKIGLPWSRELVRRTAIAVAGTLLTARLALRHGLACNTAGGTHHAFPGHGSGFCIYNDMAVAARQLIREKQLGQILILDLDVHQGDGTHAIFADEPRVFTCSLHCEKNFPVHRQPGDLDVELPEGTDDNAYLKTLQGFLPALLDRIQPDLVFYDAGVDVHAHDRIGKFALTDDGLRNRDFYVLETLCGRDIPVACVIGGGYDFDHMALVKRHAVLHSVASHVWKSLQLT